MISSAEKACQTRGIAPEIIYVINLSLEELITNALRYGSEGRQPLHFEISIHDTDDGIILKITDDANRFDPLVDAPEPDLDAEIEERRLGGLGIYLIKSMTKLVEYDYRDHRNNILIKI